MHILLVDTDKTHIRICRFLLHANGHTFKLATSADAARLKMQNMSFDVLLCDAELFQELHKENPEGRCEKINIFLFTDLKTIPQSFKVLDESFDIFPKPLDLKKIMYMQTRLQDVQMSNAFPLPSNCRILKPLMDDDLMS